MKVWTPYWVFSLWGAIESACSAEQVRCRQGSLHQYIGDTCKWGPVRSWPFICKLALMNETTYTAAKSWQNAGDEVCVQAWTLNFFSATIGGQAILKFRMQLVCDVQTQKAFSLKMSWLTNEGQLPALPWLTFTFWIQGKRLDLRSHLSTLHSTIRIWHTEKLNALIGEALYNAFTIPSSLR